jgi:putative SOS response-associated peptidase YedK
MCGRFNLTIPDFAELARLLGVEYDARLASRYRRRYNVPPSDQHWIVAEPQNNARAILPARWGYGVKKLPLARGETVSTQNLFRGAFAERRCLVPTTGFFEWEGAKGARKPHWFHRPDPSELVLLAGIYGEGPHGFDFAIVTTTSNETVRPIHDRMPVIVPLAEAEHWLRAGPSQAREMIKPAPGDGLIDTAVSTRLNAAVNDDEACLEPVSDTQRKLFSTDP